MKLGVVIPCYRQEHFLPRTVAAIEATLADLEWRGVLVMAAPGSAPLPALSPHWQVVVPPASPARARRHRALTPGAARMLGFAACGGEWVLFVDADVELDAAWFARALETARREPTLGGLWGRLEEWFVDARGERPGYRDMYRVGDLDRRTDYMATLAFYRREALVRAGGYDPRLSSEEDFELGLRLRSIGLEMRSLGLRAARHWGAPRPSFAELSRRWRTGLCFGQGQVLRLYLGRPAFLPLLMRQSLCLATLVMWGIGVAALALGLVWRTWRPLALWALLPLGLLSLLSLRKRSVRLAAHSLLAWTENGLGLLVGLLKGGVHSERPAANGSAAC